MGLSMTKTLKVLHLLGLALLLGSIFGHIVAGARHGGVAGSPELLFARQTIADATRMLTLPGLALAIASGIALALRGGRGLAGRRWLIVHAGLAVAVLALAATLIVPAGNAMLRLAAEAVAGGALGPDYAAAARTERMVGAFNVVLILLVVAIGVAKPALRWRRRTGGPALDAARR